MKTKKQREVASNSGRQLDSINTSHPDHCRAVSYKSKKLTALILAAMMIFTSLAVSVPVFAAESEITASAVPSENVVDGVKALYAHAVSGADDTEAWLAWQSEHDAYLSEVNPSVKYFFLPSSVKESVVDIYNNYSSDVSINGVTVPSHQTVAVPFEVNKEYQVTVSGKHFTAIFMKSSAEAAIYINNADADGAGTGLIPYLSFDKSLSAKATGAIVDADGNIDNTAIKKIKGRGNTTWSMPKKSFNVTYSSNVKIAGMAKGKKYSLLANYQDDSLSRNRFLYDLSDAVGMPYASDSRYVDFYSNGYYWGSYLMTEKVEVGKNSLISDIDDTAYLNADGTINEDFPFLCEVDAGAKEGDDYFVECDNGIKVTIKAPEIDPGMPGYDEVKDYVRVKYNELAAAAIKPDSDLSKYADIDSVTKLYLINELGKNWDSGVSSMFMVYKQDENGNYKFFGSPVWDYDNSLGNAEGVSWELTNIGVKDYTKYTGWWCKFKGKAKRAESSTNIMNNFARHNQVLDAAPKIWSENFVPAIEYFDGTTSNSPTADEFYSADKYYQNLKGSAEMNYKSGWPIYTSEWISDHSALNKATFDTKNSKYSVDGTATQYNSNFDGVFNYCKDWMISRSAWLSSQMYVNTVVPGENTVVYFDNTQYNWETVYLYAYHATSNGSVEVNAAWPGVPMTDLGNGMYKFVIDDSWNDAYVIFSNDDGTQYPTDIGYLIKKGETKIFNGSGLEDYTEPTPILGDVNKDGKIDILDATEIQKYAAEITELSAAQLAVADMDGDGQVNIVDATIIQKIFAEV